MLGPSGSGGASTASVAIACMAIVVHGLSSGLTHTDEQRRPPGLSTRANSAVAAARSGRNMYPNRTETLSNVASANGRSSALHTLVSKLVIPCALRSSRRDVEHLGRKVGQDDVSPRREPGDGQPRLTGARGDVEMLLVVGDVETLDHRRADRAQLIHDDRVPLLPARGEPGPRRSLTVSDLIAARHRPSRCSDASTEPEVAPRRECIMPPGIRRCERISATADHGGRRPWTWVAS